jgi:hypothetical protein
MPFENRHPKTFWSRFPPGVVVFTLLYLLLAGIGAVWTGNREFLFYLAVMVVLIAAVTVLHSRVGLSRGVLWGLSIWGLAHMAGGLVLVPESWPIDGSSRVLYSWWIIPQLLKYDHVVHAFGFGVTTFVCWQSLRAAATPEHPQEHLKPTPGLLVLCAAASMGFGALNEVVEFAATLVLPETNVGGYKNTGWDLVANFSGATAAALILFAAERR